MVPPAGSLSSLAPVVRAVGHAGRVRCEVGWELGPEWARRLTDHDLWCVWAGRGRMTTRDAVVELRPGTVVWMRPGGRYEAVQDPNARLGVSFVHFSPEAPPGWQPPFETMETRDLPLVDAMTRTVLRLREAAPAVAAALLTSLLTALAHDAQQPAPVAPPADQRRHLERMQELAGLITENPGETPTVAGLAKRAGYSVDYFSRLFAGVTGTGPQAFVVRAKVERAKQLLDETTLSIGEIAAMLGYADVYFFSRQFRQVAGIPPSRWRRR